MIVVVKFVQHFHRLVRADSWLCAHPDAMSDFYRTGIDHLDFSIAHKFFIRVLFVVVDCFDGASFPVFQTAP